jgi:hypothetical protein
LHIAEQFLAMIGVEGNEKERRIVFLEYDVQTRGSVGHLQ